MQSIQYLYQNASGKERELLHNDTQPSKTQKQWKPLIPQAHRGICLKYL
jgi:hypothetical protein